MLDIYLCEDIKIQRENLEKIIRNTITIQEYAMNIRISTESPDEIVESVQHRENRGIYFLDIDLKTDINGLQLAEKIRKYDSRGYIVFVTTHSEMAHLTFQYRVEAIDFIIKEEFETLHSKIDDCLKNIMERETLDNKKEVKNFIFKQRGYIIQEELDNIISFELFGNTHNILLCTNSRQVQFYGSLKEVEQQLDERFIRCSDSVIVNGEKIIEIKKSERIVCMENGDEYTASVRKLKEMC